MGFSASWLAMREPADHSARDSDLLEKAVAIAGENPVIMDLGSGTGSTVRAFEAVSETAASWKLIDSDPELLAIAAKSSPQATVYLNDLKNIDQLPWDGVSLVTASALLDLMTEQWLRELVERVQVPIYFALSYDGRMSWEPAKPGDSEITTSFNLHQQQDKGMGEALGPKAAEVAAKLLEQAGFDVMIAQSNWQIGPNDSDLHQQLLEGISEAASEIGNKDSERWLSEKLKNIDSLNCIIGHKDILAIPASKELAVNRAAD